PHREKDPLGLADYGIPDQLVQRFHHLAVGGTVAAELGFQVLDGAGLHLDGPLDLVSHWHTGNTLLHILSAPPAASGGRDFTAGQLLRLARTQKQPRSAAGPCTRSHPSGPDDMRLQAVCRQGTDRAVGGFALLRLAGFSGAPRRALAKTGARRLSRLPVSSAGRGRRLALLRVAGFSGAPRRALVKTGARRLICLPVSSAGRGRQISPTGWTARRRRWRPQRR